MVFKKGHTTWLGKKHSIESRKLMSLVMLGRNKGKIPWNKGLKREIDVDKIKIKLLKGGNKIQNGSIN